MASARCAYCGATLEPNSMYCMGCGQLILSGRVGEDEATGWEAPRTAAGAAAARAPRAEVQAPRSAHPASPQAWPGRVQLRFSTGEETLVAGAAVIGRRPEQTASGLGAQAIAIADSTRSISRVHLYLELADGALHAGDAGSSNGSLIERGERRIPLAATGERVDVLRGDVLWIGDVRIEIQAA